MVFKYSSVNIGVGATVTFLNHRSYAPVVWIVQSNVLVEWKRQIKRKGKCWRRCFTHSDRARTGEGSRGGSLGHQEAEQGLALGVMVRVTVALPIGVHTVILVILPLIGGSGSYPGALCVSSGGGGAIQIVAGNSVTINGEITAKWSSNGEQGRSSGGAVKIQAHQILGTGIIDSEMQGRTRMEANIDTHSSTFFPYGCSSSGATPVIWPPSNVPNGTLRCKRGRATCTS